LKEGQLETYERNQESNEDREKIDAKQTAMSNDFVQQIMGGMMQGQQQA
jgi:hypothetical protein